MEHLAYGYRRGPFLDGVQAAVGWRHFVALMSAAAVIVIVSGLVLGRPRGSEATEVSESLWLSEGKLPLLSSLARGVVAIVAVGLGSSMGRESAPQLAGSAVASWLSEFEQLPVWQRRLLVASGAGARVRRDLQRAARRGAVRAGGAAGHGRAAVRAAGARDLGDRDRRSPGSRSGPATYTLPHYLLHPGQQLVFALLAGPIIGLAAVGWVRAVKLATRLRPSGGAGSSPRWWCSARWLRSRCSTRSCWATARASSRRRRSAATHSLCWWRCWCSSRWRRRPAWGPAPRAACSRRR